MNTFDLIEKLSLQENISGNEEALDELIDSELSNKDLCISHLKNRSSLIKRNGSDSKNLIVISKDIKGFCLIPINNRSFLLPIGHHDVNKIKNAQILVQNEIFNVKSSAENPQRCEYLYIEKEFKRGTPAKEYNNIRIMEDSFSGQFVSRFAMIAKTLLNINELSENADILLASQTCIGDFSITNIINSSDYENLIVLSAYQNDSPAVIIKNGRKLSSKYLLEKIDNSYFNKKILSEAIFPPCSAHSKFINEIAFALPVCGKDSKDEKLNIKVLDEFFDNIISYLKLI